MVRDDLQATQRLLLALAYRFTCAAYFVSARVSRMNKPPADTYKVYKLYFVHTLAYKVVTRQAA